MNIVLDGDGVPIGEITPDMRLKELKFTLQQILSFFEHAEPILKCNKGSWLLTFNKTYPEAFSEKSLDDLIETVKKWMLEH